MNQKDLIELVKKMRAELGLSLMDIKAAVVEAGGDEAKAKQILKEKGLKKAEKKAERDTKEGRVFVYGHATGKMAAMVQVLCETDFVAKGDDFQNLGKDLVLHVAAMGPKDKKELLAQEFVKDPTKTIDVMIKDVVAKLGENIQIGEFVKYEI